MVIQRILGLGVVVTEVSADEGNARIDTWDNKRIGILVFMISVFYKVKVFFPEIYLCLNLISFLTYQNGFPISLIMIGVVTIFSKFAKKWEKRINKEGIFTLNK